MNSFMSMCSTLLLAVTPARALEAFTDACGLVVGRPEDVPCPPSYRWPIELEMERRQVWLCRYGICLFYVGLWCSAVACCGTQRRTQRRT